MSNATARIIDFRPDLSATFYRLNAEWLERYFQVEPVDQEILSRPVETIIAPGGAILFAEIAGSVVGTVALKHHGDGVYELTKMAVTARYQGAGIGRQLMQACINRYREIGGRELYLESHSSLKPALKLYESAGFEHDEPPAASIYRRADVFMRYRQREMDENQWLE